MITIIYGDGIHDYDDDYLTDEDVENSDHQLIPIQFQCLTHVHKTVLNSSRSRLWLEIMNFAIIVL